VWAYATDSDDEQEDRDHGAFSVCTKFVKEQLKSPESASFRNYFEDDGEVRVTGMGEGPYIVTSTVDAENSFGASLRLPFVCTVTHVSGDRWRLNDLVLDE
jgi:hypothetical protein